MKKILIITLLFLGCSTEPEKEPLNYEVIETEDGFGFTWNFIPASRFTWSSENLEERIDYDYWIQKYEVTNIQFVEFLNSQIEGSLEITSEGIFGHYNPDTLDIFFNEGNYLFYAFVDSTSYYNYAMINWDGDKFYSDTLFNNHPVVNVTWFGADAFANYYNYKLPNEYEWEKAARGDTGYDYPWGDEYGDDISQYANYYNSGDSFDNGTTPINYYAMHKRENPYGIIDMAGNAYEWTDSWFNEIDSTRVIRGGSWKSPTYSLRSWNRYYNKPYVSGPRFGFRLLALSINQ